MTWCKILFDAAKAPTCLLQNNTIGKIYTINITKTIVKMASTGLRVHFFFGFRIPIYTKHRIYGIFTPIS